MFPVFLYVFFYFFALIAEGASSKNKRRILMYTCLALVLFAGFRDMTWADTNIYRMCFEDYTPSFGKLTLSDKPFGYAERGFFYLGVFVKTFTDNVTIYFLFIALLSFYFLYKAFDKYCLYPLLGVCAYVSRFYLARNLMQIRAGLSYAVILVAVQYITKRDWKRYFALVFIAYLFHHSALIAVPLYFLCLIRIKKKHIVMGIMAAFIASYYFSDSIKLIVGENASDLNVTTYVTNEYTREYGLLNPVIYFQLFLLMIYTFSEKRMRLTTGHYETIRNAYFYSTLILITFSCYTALSGRTSSMFATLEMVIIPSLAFSFMKQNRWLAFIVMGVALTAIFYLNWARR